MLETFLARARQAHTAELEGGEEAEAGFTLIELMVVLLILAILMAIAIPTFLGVTGSANDRAAQSNLTNAITEMSAIYQSNNQSFSGGASGLTTVASSSAPEFSWTGSACTSTSASNCMSATPITSVGNSNDYQGIVLGDYSKTGTCWYAMVLEVTPTQFNSSSVSTAVPATQGSSGGDIQNAGTYYAQQKAGSSGCSSSTVASSVFKWGASYSDPNGKN
jgi:prepilin-type N-terminal cleavage/methylation domain-containing protein